MIRLSRQGWNNVIIYGVLALFFLFYIAPNHLAMMRSKEQLQAVAPGQRLLQIQFPAVLLKQAGPVWRAESKRVMAPAASAALIQQTVTAWQQLQLPQPQVNDALLAQVCLIDLTLSDEQQVAHWRLLLSEQQYWLESAAGLYAIDAKQALQLCPAEFR